MIETYLLERRHLYNHRRWKWIGLLIVIVVLTGSQRSSACSPTIACLDCQDNGDGSYTAEAGTPATFRVWPTNCAVLTTDWWVDNVTESIVNGVQYKFVHTFPDATPVGSPHTVRAVITFDSGGTPISVGSNTLSVSVKKSAFTINVQPTAGCPVTAGDGGVDIMESPNGIACSYGMAMNDPLCTEQFESSTIASLKVTPEPGYVFTGWTVNGAQVNAAVRPLLLTTMPKLASLTDVLLNNAEAATTKPNCEQPTLTLQSVTFLDTQSADVVDDTISSVDIPHWELLNPPNYRSSPAVFVRKDVMRVTAKFEISPTEFSGTVFIKGDGPGDYDFLSSSITPSGKTIKATLSSTHALADQIDIFEPMPIVWSYRYSESGQWKIAGTSYNSVYIIWNKLSRWDSVAQTSLHIGCEAAKGISGKVKEDDHLVLDAVWNNAFDHEKKKAPICRVSDGLPLTYYGFIYINGIMYDRNNTSNCRVIEADQLIAEGNGQCIALVRLMRKVLRAQGLSQINQQNFEIIQVEPKLAADYFAIKNWQKTGTARNREIIDDPDTTLDPNKNQAKDIEGIPGQGNSPNPPGEFARHFILKVRVNGVDRYYDPSYGLGYYTDLKEYEDMAFAGRELKDQLGRYLLQDLPSNNNDPQDKSDLINTYSIY